MGGIEVKEKKNIFLSVNLQFFGEAEGGENKGDDGGEQGTENSNIGDKEEIFGKNAENDTSRIDKLIQDAVKRETKKMSDENRKLTKTLEKLQKEKMSEDEIKQLEMDNKIAEIEEREKRIQEQENKLHAIKAIKSAGLDDGSENSLELIDFVMSGTKEEIDSRVKTFGVLVNKFVKAEVDKKFKENGRIPGRSNSDGKTSCDNIANLLGKMASQDNEKSRSIIDSYLNK